MVGLYFSNRTAGSTLEEIKQIFYDSFSLFSEGSLLAAD